MDHHEQHHQHHKKEREQRIEHAKERERQAEKLPQQLHPVWFVGLGIVLIGIIVLTWTFAR
jgi:hypothetical protein